MKISLERDEALKILEGMEKDCTILERKHIEELKLYARMVSAEGAQVWAAYEAEALRMAIEALKNQG